jgi:CrcB protein
LVWFMVALGGAAGSVLRYGASRLAVSLFGPTTLLNPFFVNVTGSFALGLFLTLALEKVSVPTEYRALVAVGLLGGYTTFSTLSVEAMRLAESGEVLKAGISVAGNIVVGLLAAYLGILAARAF